MLTPGAVRTFNRPGWCVDPLSPRPVYETLALLVRVQVRSRPKPVAEINVALLRRSMGFETPPPFYSSIRLFVEITVRQKATLTIGDPAPGLTRRAQPVFERVSLPPVVRLSAMASRTATPGSSRNACPASKRAAAT